MVTFASYNFQYVKKCSLWIVLKFWIEYCQSVRMIKLPCWIRRSTLFTSLCRVPSIREQFLLRKKLLAAPWRNYVHVEHTLKVGVGQIFQGPQVISGFIWWSYQVRCLTVWWIHMHCSFGRERLEYEHKQWCHTLRFPHFCCVWGSVEIFSCRLETMMNWNGKENKKC